MIKRKFKILGAKKTLDMYVTPKAFMPTGTTSLLARSAANIINEDDKVLDLGCGIGAVTLSIHALKGTKCRYYMSDISCDAIEVCKKNVSSIEPSPDVRVGDLYAPWENEQFDVILNDVSGVSSAIAGRSDWFMNVPHETSISGHQLTRKVIEGAMKHLSDRKSVLITPLISLSNILMAKDLFREAFSTVENIASELWPMPEALLTDMPYLEELIDSGNITLYKKYGTYCFETEIYLLSNQ